MFVLRETVITYRKGQRVDAPRRITSSRDVNAILHAGSLEGIGVVASGDVERFAALALDARARVIAWTIIAQGGQTFCPVSPAEVIRWALLTNAVSLVVVHNHPSGDASPSAEDAALTDRLARAANLLSLRLLDHVITTENGEYFSFLDAGLLPAP